MKFHRVALALVCGAGLSACHGASVLTPQSGDASPATAIHAPKPSCTAKPATVPGKYVGMFAVGTLSGTTFTSVFGQWSLLQYTKAVPAGSSASTPAPKPTPIPSWLYEGTYTMTKTKKQGCMLLVIGAAVKPDASGAATNGVVVAAPPAPTKKFSVTIGELGVLSMKLTGLSASGGRGTATLLTPQLKTYDTATIVLSKRTNLNNP
jgi:hypothetical protein